MILTWNNNNKKHHFLPGDICEDNICVVPPTNGVFRHETVSFCKVRITVSQHATLASFLKPTAKETPRLTIRLWNESNFCLQKNSIHGLFHSQEMWAKCIFFGKRIFVYCIIIKKKTWCMPRTVRLRIWLCNTKFLSLIREFGFQKSWALEQIPYETDALLVQEINIILFRRKSWYVCFILEDSN